MATQPPNSGWVPPPFRTQMYNSDGSMSRAWVDWFNTHGNIIQGTHAQRLDISAKTNQNLYALYYESDRSVIYTAINGVWVYVAGMMIGATDAMPADLGVNDVGFLFFDTTLGVQSYWDGTGWEPITAPAVTPGASATYPATVAALAGTISASTVQNSRFAQFGKWCYVAFDVLVTASSTSNPMQIGVTLPVPPVFPNAIAGLVQVNSSLLPVVSACYATTFGNQVIVNFPSTSSVQYLLSVGGIYETV